MTDVPSLPLCFRSRTAVGAHKMRVPNQTPLTVATDSKLFAERDGCKEFPVMTRRGAMATGLLDPLPVEAIVPWIDYDRNMENMLLSKYLRPDGRFLLHL